MNMEIQAVRPASALTFVAREQLLTITGLEEFLEFLRSGASWPPGARALILFRPDVDGYYVFGRSHFLALWLAARQLLGESQDPEAIQDLFNIHETTRVQPVGPGEGAEGPTAVTERGILVGALIPSAEATALEAAPETTPEAAPGPASELMPEQVMAAEELPPDGGRRGPLLKSGPVDESSEAVREGALESGPAATREPPSPVETLRRVPHMDLSKETPLAPQEKFEATIYTDLTAARPGEEVEEVSITAPANVLEFPVSVFLACTEHFVLTTPPRQELIIKRHEPRSASLKFGLQVSARILAPESGTLVALFHYDGRPCGKVSRSVSILPPGAGVARPAARPAEAPKQQPKPKLASPQIVIHPDDKPSDMIVTVVDPDNDQRTFDCCVQTDLLDSYRDGVWKPWNLPDVTSQIVHGYFDQFTRNIQKPQRLNALRGAGLQLFKSAPDHFKDAFWQILDKGLPLRSILIVSQEPFIPWELMIPSRISTAGPEQRQPLGAEFAIGRWVQDSNLSPAQRIKLSESMVFSPDYPGPRPAKLPNAVAEAAFVCSKFKGRPISPAIFLSLEAAMQAGGAALLHFVCHGAENSPVAQQIYLEDGTTLSSLDVEGSLSMAAACRRKKPMVFLNACEVGRAQPALVGVGGFAQTFINLGANLIIAPLWSVDDQIAHTVAEEFYQTILQTPGTPFAEAVRNIRNRAYTGATAGDDTYAAYCLYGDPLARLDT